MNDAASSHYSSILQPSTRPRPTQALQPPRPGLLLPASTYFCLIVCFEHIAEALTLGSVLLNETSEVAWVMTVVDQLVDTLRLALKDAGTDQWVPLLASPQVRLTFQSGG